jgi:hypothetical protein
MTLPMNRSGRVWRQFVGGLSAATLFLQGGCYAYLPMQTSVPATGQRIAVTLNDRGRYLLGDLLGSAVDKVDGLLVSADSVKVSLDVYRTTDIKGGTASWTGERVEVPRDAIIGYQSRQFSKRRTYTLVGVAVGVMVAVVLTTNLNLLAGPSNNGNGSVGGSTSGGSR